MIGGFAKTGIHLDLRIQIPPIRALRRIAREAAAFGFNVLLIEWEGSYPFLEHPILSNRYSYTRDEVRAFIRYCRMLGLEVIPLQQCFGHVEYILRHERYAHLRESEKDFCQLCPSRGAEALATFASIFQDLGEMHSSPYFHIGGDETYLLGSCPDCRQRVEQNGKSELYVDYLKAIAERLIGIGKRPIVWADMLLKHPEAAAKMPGGTIFMDWNYGWAPSHFGDLNNVRKHQFEFWGAAAMRSSPDNHSLISWRKHFDNLRDYPPFARQSGYRAMVLTSWSTSGIYGYQWDAGGEVQNLLPLRRVYPIGGFHILLSAFRAALSEEQPFNPAAFVQEYAAKHYGVSRRVAKHLWEALSQDDTPAKCGENLEILLKSSQTAKRSLAKLQPLRHLADFEHLRLIADLRDHHLRFKALETRIQSSWFTAARQPAVIDELDQLLLEAVQLDRRFTKLNKRDLHAEEMKDELAYRSNKLRELYSRLSRKR